MTAEVTVELRPTTLAETGLSEDLITQLVIKLLHFNADCTGVEIAHRVGLEFSVVESILETLKRSHQCEVVGGGALGAPSFRYRITDHGRRRAQLCLEHNQYVGPAPVPLAQYREYMTKFQQGTRRIVTPAAVRQAVSHLVLSDRVVNQIGPAVTSGQSLFVYGPPGNGKTVIAQALHNLLEGTDRHPARARSRRPHHQAVQPDQPRADSATRAPIPGRLKRAAIAAGFSAGGRR